jgi:hypothetical protein
MSCSEGYGYTKCPAILTFLHSFIVRYNYMHTYRIVEWYRQCTVVTSCYCLMFKPYWKQNLFGGRWQAHYVPNIAHFKLLLRSDKNTFSRKSLNAVSLAVPSTCPPNCAHIILIRSAESPVWYFISLLLFHVQKLLNWFSKYVWYFVAHTCVNSCFVFTHETKKISLEISRWTDTNLSPVMTATGTQTLNLKLIN